MDTNSRWKKAAENTDWWMAKYSHIFGIRTHSGPQEYEFISCNDLGVPYFSKVIRGKVQKTKFTLHGCDREWAAKKLEEKLNEASTRALYNDAQFGELLDLTRRLNKPHGKQLTKVELQQGDRLAGALARRHGYSVKAVQDFVARSLGADVIQVVSPKAIQAAGPEKPAVPSIAVVNNFTFNDMAKYGPHETTGVGKYKGVRYREAKVVAIDETGAERKYKVRVNTNGDVKIEDLGKTRGQRQGEAEDQFTAMPAWAQAEVNRLWPDLYVGNKTALANVYAGGKPQRLTLQAVLGGKGKAAFMAEFPGVDTVKGAVKAIAAKGKQLAEAQTHAAY